MGLTRPNARPRTIRRTLDRMKIPVRAFSGAPFAFRRAATLADVDPPTRCRRAQCRRPRRRPALLCRSAPHHNGTCAPWLVEISMELGHLAAAGRQPAPWRELNVVVPRHENLFRVDREVSAAPAASAVRTEESRNVRRFMILSFDARCSFANAGFRRGRGFVSRWRRGPRRRTSHSTSNSTPNSR